MTSKKSKIVSAVGVAAGTSTATAVGASVAPLPADHPFYAMVGRVASEWSHLEHWLDTIIWELSGGENENIACITAYLLGVPGRCRAILALGKLVGLSESALKKTKALMSSSFEIADLRARIVHDPWYIEHPSGKTAQFKTVPYGLQQINEAEFAATIERIRALHADAMDLRRDVLAELKSLRGKRA